MMRDIKFRIPHYNFKGKFVQFSYWGHLEKGSFTSPSQIHRAMDKKHDEQYTGLKDKSGKEIYEGDVVRFKTPKDKTLTTDVVWSTGSHGFVFRGQSYYVVVFSTLEIIGNIHEEKL